MSGQPRVAVLGAGIMGACTALFLARRGASVTLFEQTTTPMAGASRWNEGKIHLGYLYGADPTLLTCRMVLPGGLKFVRLVEELIATPVTAHMTVEDDIFLCHRDSVVEPGPHKCVLDAVSELVRDHPDVDGYPGDLRKAEARPLTPAELRDLSCGEEIVAGYRVPERSLNTLWLADRLVEALNADPKIELRCGVRVTAVTGEDGGTDRWRVETPEGSVGGFGAVINALWNGRLAIDRTAGLETGSVWSHRYRVAAFLRCSRPIDVKSTLVCVGAFGDVKNFGGKDFYVSWYPAGLLLDSADLDPASPPPFTEAERNSRIAAIRAGIGAHVPGIEALFNAAEDIRIEGGFVFAEGGKGRIDERSSTLHARDHFGVRRRGSYFSVDTGKWSTAPDLAKRLADELIGV